MCVILSHHVPLMTPGVPVVRTVLRILLRTAPARGERDSLRPCGAQQRDPFYHPGENVPLWHHGYYGVTKQTSGHGDLGGAKDEKPACFLNLAGLFWKSGCPLVWQRRCPFCWITKPCSAAAVVCLPPQHPPCVHTSSSRWTKGAHDKGGLGFSGARQHP